MKWGAKFILVFLAAVLVIGCSTAPLVTITIDKSNVKLDQHLKDKE